MGKKVTFKNLPSREFRRYLTRRPYPRDTRKILQAGMTLQLPAYAFHMALSQVCFSRNPLVLQFMLNSSQT